MKRIFVAALVVACVPSLAEVYKWKDAGGRVHFGDKPPASVASEELRIQSFSGPAEVSGAAGEEGPGTGKAAGGAAAVTLYTTAWCGVCKQAKQWLTARGVAYAEIDIEKDAGGKVEYKRLGGRGVPLILVGQQRMNGFSAARLEQMLKASGS